MDNGTGLTASDVALLNNDGMGGWNGMIWLFAILALFGGGGFGFGNNNFANAIGYENLATSNEVQRGFDNQNQLANEREILGAVNAGTAQAVAATNQTFHDTLGIIQNRYDELSRDISGLAVGQAQALANQNACCCETKQLIMQSNYDGAMRDAATNANFTAQIQSVKDMIAQDKIESLQNQVNMLTTQGIVDRATAGVVKYPNNTMYAVPSPCFGGCNC